MRCKHLFLLFCLCICLMPLCVTAANTNNSILSADVLQIACVPEDACLFDQTIAAFETSNPNIRVQVQTMESDQLRESLYHQDGSIDVYYISSNGMNQAYLIENGLIIPMESDSVIYDIRTMYPQVQEYVTRRGMCWGYPVCLRGCYWAVDSSLLEAYNLGDTPTTLSAYLAMMAHWNQLEEHGDHAFTDTGDTVYTQQQTFDAAVTIYLNTLASQNKTLTFDTPDFRLLLESMRFMSGGESGHPEFAASPIFSFPALSPLSAFGMSIPDRYMLTPALYDGADPCVNAYLDYLVIPSSTEKTDMARRFIETYAESADSYYRCLLHPYRVSILEDELTTAGSPTDAIRAYRRLASHLSLEQGALLGCLLSSDALWQSASQYLSQSITIEEAITKMDTHLLYITEQLAHVGWAAE